MSKTVAGIILAAGGSSRFGSPKQLLPWRGKTVLGSVVNTAMEARLQPLVVVLGANAEQLEPLIPEDCIVVKNEAWSTGQSSSLRLGIDQLPEDIDGALILLGDQPQIHPFFCDCIVHHGIESGNITLPYVNDRKANPVFFPKYALKRLAEVKGDQGGRAIFSEFQLDLLPWLDDCMALDIDTPEDYERLKACYTSELSR